MDKTIRYSDLWALLRELGFDCDAMDDRNHRICDFAPTETRIVLHDYPPTNPVHHAILIGVRLQLDNGGVMSRAGFDQWAAKHGGVMSRSEFDQWANKLAKVNANGTRSKRGGKKVSNLDKN